MLFSAGVETTETGFRQTPKMILLSTRCLRPSLALQVLFLMMEERTPTGLAGGLILPTDSQVDHSGKYPLLQNMLILFPAELKVQKAELRE